jgi:50S ribosomal subunit-associated GTPase HflX
MALLRPPSWILRPSSKEREEGTLGGRGRGEDKTEKGRRRVQERRT